MIKTGKYVTKWKDEYRCVAPYDEETGQFPRDSKGNLSEEDIYIECANGDIIFDYASSKGILEAHINSRQRGRGIVSQLIGEDNFKKLPKYSDCGYGYYDYAGIKNDIILKVEENDQELWFYFNGNKHLDVIAKIMKAKKPKANTSPFNSQYLPSHKEKLEAKKLEEARYVKYEMPKGYWDEMKVILPKLMKQKSMMMDKVLDDCYKKFGKEVKKNLIKDADENNYKINHYIHHLGLWDDFVNFTKQILGNA